MRTALKVLLALLMSAFPLSGQVVQSSSSGAAQEPRNVTYCELGRDPAAYNHELIRLTAFLTHGFEDFQLAEPNCPDLPYDFSVWVTYGGKVQSNTIYCCPGEGGKKARSKSLTVEGVQVPLLDDFVFHQFTHLLEKEPDTTVRATVVGRFFAGEKWQSPLGSTLWGGFGHLGCCSLFVIQRVESFEPHTRKDVDYTAEAGSYEENGCSSGRGYSYSGLRYVSLTDPEEAIAEQALADSGERAWAFTDPQRVAVESLKSFYKDRVLLLRCVKKTPARQVFRWEDGKTVITVVVTRPYWLSFYSKSGSVAWVSTMIGEAHCG